MTPISIEETVKNAFMALYPRHVIDVVGAGTEQITVNVISSGSVPNAYARTFECEIDSDDDGNFWFRLSDTPVMIAVPYPEED